MGFLKLNRYLTQFSVILGYAAWIDKVSPKDCTLVEILYEAGAVPFVRTNVPQSLVILDPRNLCDHY